MAKFKGNKNFDVNWVEQSFYAVREQAKELKNELYSCTTNGRFHFAVKDLCKDVTELTTEFIKVRESDGTNGIAYIEWLNKNAGKVMEYQAKLTDYYDSLQIAKADYSDKLEEGKRIEVRLLSAQTD